MPPDDATFGIENLKLEADPSLPQKHRDRTGRTIADISSYEDKDGRTYHGWMAGEYALPNDGEEQDRQDIQHAFVLNSMDNKLTLAPVMSPKHVLDIGTGTGIWAIEYAEQNPEASVVGTDLSLIQPPPRVPNCHFILENSETQDWLFPYLFDLIYLRAMGPCFNNFGTVLQRSYNHTSPGGWIELVDASWELRCIDDTISGTALERWFQLIVKAGLNSGRDMIKARYYKQYLQQAGYVDVVEQVFPSPGSPWPKDKKMKERGMWLGYIMLKAADSYKNFLSYSGISSEEIDELTIQVKRDMKDIRIHWYIEAYVVYGRKPFDGEIVQSVQGFI